MSIFLELIFTYEREIAICALIVLGMLMITNLIITLGIGKKLRKITKDVDNYISSVIESEEINQQAEIQRAEQKKRQAIEEEQTQLISKVLEEIFP